MRRLILWILGLGLVALSCNAPFAMPAAIEPSLPQEIWRTPTAAPFFIPTPQPQPVVDALDTAPPTSEAGSPLLMPTVPTPDPANTPPILYYTQAGDTLPVLAIRYGVAPEEITSPEPIPETAIINPDQLLIIPNRLPGTTTNVRLLPDSEFVFSPSALNFDVDSFVRDAGGYLNEYEEYLRTTGVTSGIEIVKRVAIENSVNPRLLLALLEYKGGWVYSSGDDLNLAQKEYPMGFIELKRAGLFRQLVWAVNHLSIGYYGWREGLLTEIRFHDGSVGRLAPDLNAGTVALQYFFAQQNDPEFWQLALKPESGFPALFHQMFGNPWVRAMAVEPLFPPELAQPALILPFVRGHLWSYSGGPHGAWESAGAMGALDFAPGSEEPGCVESFKKVLAAAPGLVTRSGNGVVMLDLDGDGNEQTGWGLLYLHISANGGLHPAPVGTWVDRGDVIGYPSCEGGAATGTHIHLARKYNGEWIPADGPLPFVLGGWTAHAGAKPYQGTLTRDGVTIHANQLGTFITRITRGENDP